MSSTSYALGDVAEFINGAAFKPTDWSDEGSRIIRIQNLTDKKKPYNRTTRNVNERIQVQPGDLLVSWSATLGVFEWDGPDVAFLNQHIFRVLPNSQKVHKRYLRHALEVALLDMRRHLHGATMLHVNRAEFLATKLFVPPLSEQQRIAAILDKVDNIRLKRREVLAQLDRLVRSIFVNMFGDPVTGNGRDPVVSVESIAAPGKYSIVDGPFGSSIRAEDYRESGVPVIRISNITKGGEFLNENLLYIERSLFEKLKRSRVGPRDVLISRVGTIGNTCVFPPNFGDALLSTTGVCKITPNEAKVLPEFLHHAILHPSFQDQIHKSASTSVQKYFNLSALKSWSVVQPAISRQEEFRSLIARIQRKKREVLTSALQLDALFASIQHRAFRGEL